MAVLEPRLTWRFGITHPIVLAPMALVCGGALAAAVTQAGGPDLLRGRDLVPA
jgi:nitronate monooxygenase